MSESNQSEQKRSVSPEVGSNQKRRKGFSSSDGHVVSGKQLFVSNLPYDVSWQNLKDLFKEQVGEVPYVKLYNNEQGKPRGCGLVEFKTKELAKVGLEKMQGYDIKGRKIKVNEAFDEPRDEHGYLANSKSSRGENQLLGRSTSRDLEMLMNGGGGPRRSSFQHPDETYGLSKEFLSSLSINGPITNRLWVSNLDAEKTDEKKLMEIFRFAGKVVIVQLNRDREGKSKGHAIIEYSHPLEAIQAISMINNQALYGKKIFVRLDRVGVRNEDRYPQRLPEGLSGFSNGLGLHGVPLQNIASKLTDPSSGGTDGEHSLMLVELKRAKQELSLLQNQLEKVGGIEGLARLSKSISGPVKDERKELFKTEPSRYKSAQEMLDMLQTAKSGNDDSLIRDYDHRSATSAALTNYPSYLEYGSKWF